MEEKAAATKTLKLKDKYLKAVYAWIYQNQNGQDRDKQQQKQQQKTKP